MINNVLIEIKKEPIEADVEVILVVDKNFEHQFIKTPASLFDKCGFSANHEETLFLVEQNRVFVGCESLKANDIKSAIASAIRVIIGTKYSSLKIATYHDIDTISSIGAIVEGIILGAYTFDKYKSKKSELFLSSVVVSLEEYNSHEIDEVEASKALVRAKILANATNMVRDIVNTPPDDFYPEIMANIAKELSDNSTLECEILEVEELKKENMNALLAVARASRHTPRVIHLTHKVANPKAKVVLVGKGLTYDSGGLSLKPSDYMVTMKSDKSGGSAVLGILKAVNELGLDIEVHGFVGAVENMIGGDAYKPDDVLVAKNGKTIEVRNTDAEGRIVLADVLSLAQQRVEDLDYIFDMATLTGACVVAVGHYTSGVMGFSDEVKDKVIKSANVSGELASKLDFNRHLKKTIKSEIADVCNISSTRYGGAITASMFLSEFIEEKNRDKWVHIDIAGPAFVEHTWAENPYGASGAGVRMMTTLIENLCHEK